MDETPEFSTIRLKLDGQRGVATITLDRPKQQNSLNVKLFDELDSAIELVDGDDEIRCLVITGDDTFSVGGDISMFRDLDQYEFLSAPMDDVFRKLEELPVLTIAAIDGYCLGGGIELAITCDFRVATERSTFGTSEIHIGLFPGSGGTQRLTRLIGLANAKEVVLFGDEYNAEEAAEMDLVTKVVSHGEFDNAVEELADKLASGPPIAQQAAKLALQKGSDGSLDSGLALENSLIALLFGTEDLQEGIEAFDANREPEFEGR